MLGPRGSSQALSLMLFGISIAIFKGAKRLRPFPGPGVHPVPECIKMLRIAFISGGPAVEIEIIDKRGVMMNDN